MPFLLPLVLLAWSFEKVAAQNLKPVYFAKDSIASYRLLPTKGAKLNYTNRNPLSCFVFLSPECPLSKNYAALIGELKKRHNSNVLFYFIIPGNAYSMGELKSFSKKYLSNAVVHKDVTFGLSNYLQATVTPEVVLMESETGKAIYRGALDNWAFSLGKQRMKATEHYLSDAIESYLRRRPPTVTFKEPVGCLINDF